MPGTITAMVCCEAWYLHAASRMLLYEGGGWSRALICCYAMSGTERTNELWLCYAMSGTETASVLRSCYVKGGFGVQYS
eukprot:676329-Rhodomonas_salina.1